MTNFDHFKKDEQFNSFVDIAITAEKLVNIDINSSVLNSRKALEFAIKWMYSVDSSLVRPYQDNLQTLICTDEFRDIVDNETYRDIDFIRKAGNKAAHTNVSMKKEIALICLENLFLFFDLLSYYYSEEYIEKEFDLKVYEDVEIVSFVSNYEELQIDLDRLLKENSDLKEQITKTRTDNPDDYKPKPSTFTETETRKAYIDLMLIDAGWKENINWINEVKVDLPTNKTGVGFVDYVLYDDRHIPLAIIEAKKNSVDISKARQQAKEYADSLEKKYGRRPIIFISNGYETRIIDGKYQERKVSSVYSKSDLEKIFNLRSMMLPLNDIWVNPEIAGRYYQVQAIKASCESLEANKRKILLVMATGSGKTRTVIGLVDILLSRGWIKNVLFLADRNSLVIQAKRNFVNLLPNLSVTNLCEEKDNYLAHAVFSTYQTIYNVIDSAKTDGEKIFTPGHFDLVIVDEAHRSIYNKYKDIFEYFDAPLVGLTATPKDEIDKNTYDIFDLENGVPTFGYELAQAVKDGFLVDYKTIEVETKFLTKGIHYDDLTEEEKERVEDTFLDDDGNIIETIEPSALNKWIFNVDTIKQVLNIVMRDLLKVDFGQKIGKTIIFAKNHRHAEFILEVFNKEFPSLVGDASVIDNYIKKAQTLIDDFSDPKKRPQIAISVDMLDTGIDVPEVLNLVFFKRVMSKAKFWQMIGRGTRLCPGLQDGMAKEFFYIFDFCGNFEFFRLSQGSESPTQTSLESRLFNIKFELVYELGKMINKPEELSNLQKKFIAELIHKVRGINKDNFAARQHLQYIEKYERDEDFNLLTKHSLIEIREHVSPYVIPTKEDFFAQRFDHLIYAIEVAILLGNNYSKAKNQIKSILELLSTIENIPEVDDKKDFINVALSSGYIEKASIIDFEHLREEIRSLIKYITAGPRPVFKIDIEDEIADYQTNDSEFTDNYLEDYKKKAEHFIKTNQKSNIVIAKIKNNKKLTSLDVKELERILWKDLGTKEDYLKEYGEKPLGELVREIVGLDMNAAKDAFATFLLEYPLNERQIYFVNTVIEYIVVNGLVRDKKILNEAPFSDRGNVIELFGENIPLWNSFVEIIDLINSNVEAV